MDLFNFYLVLFLVGLLWLVVSALLGGFLGGDHDGGGADAGGVDAGGAAGAGGGLDAGSVIQFSPLSPTFISMFLTVFGGVGCILIQISKAGGFTLGVGLHLGIASLALLAGVGISFLLAMAMTKIFLIAEGSVTASSQDYIGVEGEVITPIPSGGTGEIVCVVKEARRNAPAKNVNSLETIPAQSVVVIEKVVGGILFVRRKEPGKV